MNHGRLQTFALVTLVMLDLYVWNRRPRFLGRHESIEPDANAG